jgi:membrane fusion protein (multidrug efflux system)
MFNNYNTNHLFSLILSFTLVFFSCSNKTEIDENSTATWKPDENTTPIAVEVVEVSRGKLIPFIESSGILYGSKEAWAVSETQGKITKVVVSLGQSVKKGDVLLQVENRLPQLNRELSFQQLESARLDLEAIESSFKGGGSSRSSYNSARVAYLQALNAFENAEKTLDNTSIRAPFDGSVALMDSSLTEGSFLTQGIKVAKIIDTSLMKMELSLGERQINLIKTGIPAQVSVSSDYNGGTIDAEVSAIGTGSDKETGSYSVIISWNNTGNNNFKSGMSASVRIESIDENPQIIIPSSAIIIRDRKKSVIIADGGKASIRNIETGDSLGGHTIITSGLEEGESLIISALSYLGNDYLITAKETGKSGEWE